MKFRVSFRKNGKILIDPFVSLATNERMLRAFYIFSILAFFAPVAQAAVTLYQETFNQAGTLNSSRWIGYYDTNAKILDVTSGTSDLYYRGSINDSASNWTNNPTYLYVQSRGTEAQAALAMNYFLMASGSKPTVQLGLYQQLSVSWANYGGAASTAHQIAAQVNGQWYVSTTKINGGSANTVSVLNFDSTSWTPLNFVANSQLSIGNGVVQASALFANGATLTNLGFHIQAAGTTSYMTQRFGDLTLVGEAVPEPSLWMLSFIGLLGLGFRRARTLKTPK